MVYQVYDQVRAKLKYFLRTGDYKASFVGELYNKIKEIMLYTLFSFKGFMLDKKLQRKAAKFAIFLEYENPSTTLFSFYISSNFISPIMNALANVDIDQRKNKD